MLQEKEDSYMGSLFLKDQEMLDLTIRSRCQHWKYMDLLKSIPTLCWKIYQKENLKSKTKIKETLESFIVKNIYGWRNFKLEIVKSET